MTEFDIVQSDDKIGMFLLSEKLNNRRDLSLFFVGTGETISKKGFVTYFFKQKNYKNNTFQLANFLDNRFLSSLGTYTFIVNFKTIKYKF